MMTLGKVYIGPSDYVSTCELRKEMNTLKCGYMWVELMPNVRKSLNSILYYWPFHISCW